MPVTDRQGAIEAIRSASASLDAVSEYLAAETPPKPPKPPRTAVPLFGLDISSANADLDLARAYSEGYEFAWIKVSEGPYRDGTSYVNPEWPRQYREALAAGYAIGFYFYLVENNPKNPAAGAAAQVDLFLRQLAGHYLDVPGHGIAVDFERYNQPYFYLTPSNETLEATGKELTRRLPAGYPKTLYSSVTFWNGEQEGTVASGKWARYGFDVAWVAEWRRNGPEPAPQRYYTQMTDELNPLKGKLGGKAADIGQFCIGNVAGQNVDVNAYPGSLADYMQLTTGTTEAPPKPPPVKPPPTKPPTTSGWNPVTGSLAPPGFVRRAPQPGSARYDLRYPTRFIWRPDVEEIVRKLYAAFGKYNIFINTYVKHPATIRVPRPNVSLDVWGGRGNAPGNRGLWLPEEIGAKVWRHVWDDPKPPDIAWGIYHRKIYGDWSGYTSEPFGDGSRFINHDDHFHITLDRKSVV